MTTAFKVGDLVVMPDDPGKPEDIRAEARIPGIVVDISTCAGKTNRVGIMWTDGDRVDWEPRAWLKVINESR